MSVANLGRVKTALAMSAVAARTAAVSGHDRSDQRLGCNLRFLPPHTKRDLFESTPGVY